MCQKWIVTNGASGGARIYNLGG